MRLRKDRKFQRQAEAKLRNEAWAKLTNEEKLVYFDKLNLVASKQRQKLTES